MCVALYIELYLIEIFILLRNSIAVASKPLRRGFLICLAAFISHSFTGMFVINSYAVPIFMESGKSSLTPELVAVIYSCIQILGALCTSWLIERLGRKVVLHVKYTYESFKSNEYFYYYTDTVSILLIRRIGFNVHHWNIFLLKKHSL